MAAAAGGRTPTRILESELIFVNGIPPRGQGAFGKVVSARYKGGLVAVKSLAVAPGKITPAEQAALDAEIAALAGLKHPNIITLVGICYHADGAVSIVEELADCDLVDFVSAMGGHVPTEIVYKLGLDIARGMGFMHANGLSHNDLKCANVLLVKGCATLCDFGLVRKFTSTLRAPSLTQGAVGTLPYMAPEQMDPDDPFYMAPTADVYSFGCILYELATGKCPWHDKAGWGTMQFLKAVNMGKQRPPLDAVEPAALRALIAPCWGEPAERPNAAALVQQLTALHIGSEAASRASRAAGAQQDIPKLRNLVDVCRRHGIRPDYTPALRNLEAFDIVLIADDSGSMGSAVKQGDGAAKHATRWDELKDMAKVVVELAAALDDDGADVYFLNRPPAIGVKNAAAVEGSFTKGPSGGTPLTATLTRALHDKGYRLAGEAPAEGAAAAAAAAAASGRAAAGPSKRLLFLICTDGVPDEGHDAFVATLQQLPENCYVQLVAVTDDDKVVKWMNSADERVRFVDVNDVRWGTRLRRPRAPSPSLTPRTHPAPRAGLLERAR